MINNKELYELSKTPFWRILKIVLEEELFKLTDLEKISSFEELCGAKLCKKWVKQIIKKVEGSKDVIEFQ